MQDGWCRWSQAGTLFICFLFLRHSFLRNTLKLKAMAWMAIGDGRNTGTICFLKLLSAFYCFASHCSVSNWERCSQWSKAQHSPVIFTPSCTSCCFASPHGLPSCKEDGPNIFPLEWSAKWAGHLYRWWPGITVFLQKIIGRGTTFADGTAL